MKYFFECNFDILACAAFGLLAMIVGLSKDNDTIAILGAIVLWANIIIIHVKSNNNN